MKKTDSFSGKLGFILAAAGSAVGLGNIWRFPYLAAQYGGGIFLLTYLVLVLTFGYTMLISENAIGRMTRQSAIGAYRDLCRGSGKRGKIIQAGGWVNAAVSLIILPYYCVVGGWVTKYVVTLCTTPAGNFSKDVLLQDPGGKTLSASEAYFNGFITSTWEPGIYLLIFAALIALVVSMGIVKGVERFNKILMPLLVIMIAGICFYCMFLPNAGEGLAYYLMPDWTKFSYMTVAAALGQLFYSLSIAMGIMITFGAYMRKEDDLVSGANQVEIFDTAVAFLAGLMIIPAVVAFGGKEAAETAGAGLMFVTMPQVFASFRGGQIAGIVFFILVLFAAMTSAVSMLETNVHSIQSEAKVSRARAIGYAVAEILAVGIITVWGYSVLSHVHPLAFVKACQDKNILDSLDFVSNSILMPVAAVFTAILVLSVVGLDRMTHEIRGGNKAWKREWLYRFCMRFLVIPGLLVVLLYATGLLH